MRARLLRKCINMCHPEPEAKDFREAVDWKTASRKFLGVAAASQRDDDGIAFDT